MIIAIVGTGNSGSALVMRIAETVKNCTVRVASHRRESAQAAVLDAASVFPDRVARFEVCGLADTGDADVIAICAGMQIGKGQTAADLLAANALLMKSLLLEIKPKSNAVIILIASPVDDITVVAQVACGLPAGQVIGFGGDLDTSRLQYSLLRRGIDTRGISVVGEHGGRAIPVYAGEAEYDAVAEEVRALLSRITKSAGPPRNLATGVHLATLIQSIISDSRAIHHVCGYHAGFGCHLTWPFEVGRGGLLAAADRSLPPRAAQDLDQLLVTRSAARPRLLAL